MFTTSSREMLFALAIAIGITVGFVIPAAHANWRHHHYYGWQQRIHPACGRDSAKHRQDTNPE